MTSAIESFMALFASGKPPPKAPLSSSCPRSTPVSQLNQGTPEADDDLSSLNSMVTFDLSAILPELDPEGKEDKTREMGPEAETQMDALLSQHNEDSSDKLVIIEAPEASGFPSGSDQPSFKVTTQLQGNPCDDRPPYSYTELIEFALRDRGSLAVRDIYTWIQDNFEFYKTLEESKWQPSVRHTLTISRRFKKVGKCRGGHQWGLAPETERTPGKNNHWPNVPQFGTGRDMMSHLNQDPARTLNAQSGSLLLDLAISQHNPFRKHKKQKIAEYEKTTIGTEKKKNSSDSPTGSSPPSSNGKVKRKRPKKSRNKQEKQQSECSCHGSSRTVMKENCPPCDESSHDGVAGGGDQVTCPVNDHQALYHNYFPFRPRRPPFLHYSQGLFCGNADTGAFGYPHLYPPRYMRHFWPQVDVCDCWPMETEASVNNSQCHAPNHCSDHLPTTTGYVPRSHCSHGKHAAVTSRGGYPTGTMDADAPLDLSPSGSLGAGDAPGNTHRMKSHVNDQATEIHSGLLGEITHLNEVLTSPAGEQGCNKGPPDCQTKNIRSEKWAEFGSRSDGSMLAEQHPNLPQSLSQNDPVHLRISPDVSCDDRSHLTAGLCTPIFPATQAEMSPCYHSPINETALKQMGLSYLPYSQDRPQDWQLQESISQRNVKLNPFWFQTGGHCDTSQASNQFASLSGYPHPHHLSPWQPDLRDSSGAMNQVSHTECSSQGSDSVLCVCQYCIPPAASHTSPYTASPQEFPTCIPPHNSPVIPSTVIPSPVVNSKSDQTEVEDPLVPALQAGGRMSHIINSVSSMQEVRSALAQSILPQNSHNVSTSGKDSGYGQENRSSGALQVSDQASFYQSVSSPTHLIDAAIHVLSPANTEESLAAQLIRTCFTE